MHLLNPEACVDRCAVASGKGSVGGHSHCKRRHSQSKSLQSSYAITLLVVLHSAVGIAKVAGKVYLSPFLPDKEDDPARLGKDIADCILDRLADE